MISPPVSEKTDYYGWLRRSGGGLGGGGRLPDLIQNRGRDCFQIREKASRRSICDPCMQMAPLIGGLRMRQVGRDDTPVLGPD